MLNLWQPAKSSIPISGKQVKSFLKSCNLHQLLAALRLYLLCLWPELCKYRVRVLRLSSSWILIPILSYINIYFYTYLSRLVKKNKIKKSTILCVHRSFLLVKFLLIFYDNKNSFADTTSKFHLTFRFNINPLSVTSWWPISALLQASLVSLFYHQTRQFKRILRLFET